MIEEDTRIVDEHVNMPEGLSNLINHLFNLIWFTKIGLRDDVIISHQGLCYFVSTRF